MLFSIKSRISYSLITLFDMIHGNKISLKLMSCRKICVLPVTPG